MLKEFQNLISGVKIFYVLQSLRGKKLKGSNMGDLFEISAF